MRLPPARWLALLGLVFGQAEDPPVVPRLEELPDGGRVERTVLANTSELVDHGPYRRWYPNGQLACEGKYLDGVRVGPWVTYYPDGTRESEGVYRRGLRNRKWSYWHEDGERNGAESGEYHAEFESFASGAPRVEGERRLKFRHGVRRWFWEAGGMRCEGHYHNDDRSGTWTWFRPDGSVLYTGEVERVREKGEWISRRAGRWTFAHPDGLPDPGFLSGDYEEGVRRPGDAPITSALDAWLNAGALPRPRRSPGAATEVERIAVRAIEQLCEEDPERWPKAAADLRAREAVALPLVLWSLSELRIDPELGDDDPGAQAARRLAEHLPHAFLAGDSLRWSGGTDPEARRRDRLVLRRWLTLWELFCEDPAELFGARDVARDSLLERIVGATPQQSGPLGESATCPTYDGELARIAWGPDLDLLTRHGGLETEAPLETLLARLRATQDADGSWSSELETTALAALAFAGVDSSTRRGPHRESLAAAVAWIAGHQDPGTGAIRASGDQPSDDLLVEHALALSAWIEAVHGVRDPAQRVRIQASVDSLVKAQEQAGSWTTPDGRSATEWVAVILAIAEDRGFRFVGNPFRPALAHFAARRSEGERGLLETAACLWLEHLQYHAPADYPSMARAAEELLERLPELAGRTEEADLVRWYFGTNAAFQTGGETWAVWNEAMKATLLAEPEDGAELGPRATALRALCFEVYTRYRRMND